MVNWAVCLNEHNFFQHVVSYTLISPEIARVYYKNKSCDIPVNNIRPINAPEFVFGDIVSPINHLDITGTVCGIMFHFKRNEPIYFISINGKRKSKRYFKDELTRIENLLE